MVPEARDEAGWTPADLSAATGEPIDQLAKFAERGLLIRQAGGSYNADSLNRVLLIRFARERGVDEDRLAAAVDAQGDLLGIFDALSTGEPTEHTLQQAASAAGLPSDIIAELGEVLVWDATARATTQDVDALVLLAQALEMGLDRTPLLELVRVYADLLDRLADAEVRIFHEYVHEEFRSQGLSGPELLEATESLGKPLLKLVEPAVVYFHRRAWQRVNGEDLLRHVMESEAPPTPTPGELVVTVLFIDLAGYTPLTLAMGDAIAADVLRRFAAVVRAGASTMGGRIVKQIGDAFMLTFVDAGDAIRFGLDVRNRVEEESQFPAVHLGAHTGPVLFREADYVGAAVNLAARVASAGSAGQFLITEAVRAAAVHVPDAEFTSLPARTLKGITEPVQLMDVRQRGREASATSLHIDPVCGMQLDPSDVATTTNWRGESYYFCSQECADAFVGSPERFEGRTL